MINHKLNLGIKMNKQGYLLVSLCVAAILLAFLSFLPDAFAEKDSVTTGPFKVSFDLGLPKDTYSVTVGDPKEQESLSGDKSTDYSIEIRNSTGLAGAIFIGFTDFQKDVIPTPTSEDLKAVLRSLIEANEIGFENIRSAERMIDGKQGAVASGKLSRNKIEGAMYCATYYPSARTGVLIMSMYPWDEGTLQLLRTIHVEVTNQTERDQLK